MNSYQVIHAGINADQTTSRLNLKLKMMKRLSLILLAVLALSISGDFVSAEDDERNRAGVRSERAMHAALQSMVAAEKITEKQVREIHRLIFPDSRASARGQNRSTEFGTYLNSLIKNGQVQQRDEDLKKVRDIGVAEIKRQGNGPAQARRPAPARGEMAESDDTKKALGDKLRRLVEAGKLTREEAADLYRTAFPDNAPNMERQGSRNRRVVEVKDPALFGKDSDNPIFSGPQPGEKLAGLNVTGLVGPHKDAVINPVDMAGDRPHVIIFQDNSGVAIRGLYQASDLLGKIDKISRKDMHITCVFLSDDPADVSQFSRVFPAMLERGVDVVAFSKDGREGPGAYGLNRSVSQTILLANGKDVIHNFVFPQGMSYADPYFLGGIADLMGHSREKVQKVLNQEGPDDARMRRR